MNMVKKPKKKKSKKKIKIISKSIHIKKLANRTFSEYLQNIIDKFDKPWLEKHIQIELNPLPKAFTVFIPKLFKELGTYFWALETRGDLDLKSDSCKKIYNTIVDFLHIKKYAVFFVEKNYYDNMFFAFAYGIASSALNSRDIRKLYGIRKGLFG